MGKHRVFRAIFIRTVFTIHAFFGIWLVVDIKNDRWYWYLGMPIFILLFETAVTLSVRKNLEWKWFCPSVFLYLASIVPAIWLLELDKVDRRMKAIEELPLYSSTHEQFKEINTMIGVQIKLPDISMSTETWITLIEQFLMLILIIGRWLLPKGDLTRDQLSQLLLVYIGTAADIIEFFDSFKDDKIAAEPILVLLTLAIWSWSLMQFTVVLTATKARKSRFTTTGPSITTSSTNFCTIDVCSILLNIILQDAPFLAFRLLLITHFKIISYMNVFFTCKNTLVIILQIYRLYVVYSEHHRMQKQDDFELSNISIISRSDIMYNRRPRRPSSRLSRETVRKEKRRVEQSEDSSDTEGSEEDKPRNRTSRNSRKDTGYSTASSHTSVRNNYEKSHSRRMRREQSSSREFLDQDEPRRTTKQKSRRTNGETRGRGRVDDAFSEESDNRLDKEMNKKENPKKGKRVSKNIYTNNTSDQTSE